MTLPVRVLLADDHTLVRESLVAILHAAGGIDVVAQAGDGVETVDLAIATRPDVAVVDLSMPRLHGIEVVRRLQAALPDTRVLVLTMHDEDEYVLRAVRAGAAGYLVKDSPAAELVEAVRAVHAGRDYFGPQAAHALAGRGAESAQALDDPYGALTPREREVLHLIADGLTTKEIARTLGISAKTAENHRARVIAKFNVRNTAELVRAAVRRGLLA